MGGEHARFKEKLLTSSVIFNITAIYDNPHRDNLSCSGTSHSFMASPFYIL